VRTAVQVVRSWWLGGYAASVVGGELRVHGPQPMSPELKEAVRARRGELVELLTTYCGGTWPPAPGAVVADNEERALFMLEIPGQVAEPPVTVRPRRKVAA
jgi:hypothetical protein